MRYVRATYLYESSVTTTAINVDLCHYCWEHNLLYRSVTRHKLMGSKLQNNYVGCSGEWGEGAGAGGWGLDNGSLWLNCFILFACNLLRHLMVACNTNR